MTSTLIHSKYITFVYSDINECTDISPCDANARCSNIFGSYTCLCEVGYTGDGENCRGETRNNYSVVIKQVKKVIVNLATPIH